MKKKSSSIVSLFKLIYLKLFRIDDTPQRIALGLGIGVLLGILPGSGPIAALFLAWVLRVNQASALLGSLFTNTWLSIVTFILSIKVGSIITKLNWQDVQRDWMLFLKNFHWLNLCKLSVLKIILPVMIGYFIVAFCIGLMVYLITIIILTWKKHEPRSS